MLVTIMSSAIGKASGTNMVTQGARLPSAHARKISPRTDKEGSQVPDSGDFLLVSGFLTWSYPVRRKRRMLDQRRGSNRPIVNESRKRESPTAGSPVDPVCRQTC